MNKKKRNKKKENKNLFFNLAAIFSSLYELNCICCSISFISFR